MSDRYRIFSGINCFVVRDQEEGKFVSWHKSIEAARSHVDSLCIQAAGRVHVGGARESRPRTKEELAAQEDAAYKRALINKHTARDNARANEAQLALYAKERAEPKVQRAKAETALDRELAANEAQLALYAKERAARRAQRAEAAIALNKERTAREPVERARVSEQTIKAERARREGERAALVPARVLELDAREAASRVLAPEREPVEDADCATREEWHDLIFKHYAKHSGPYSSCPHCWEDICKLRRTKPAFSCCTRSTIPCWASPQSISSTNAMPPILS